MQCGVAVHRLNKNPSHNSSTRLRKFKVLKKNRRKINHGESLNERKKKKRRRRDKQHKLVAKPSLLGLYRN
jgi:hypothetical protein